MIPMDLAWIKVDLAAAALVDGRVNHHEGHQPVQPESKLVGSLAHELDGSRHEEVGLVPRKRALQLP